MDDMIDQFLRKVMDCRYLNQLSEVEDLMLKLERDPIHCAHVGGLALQLFDQLILQHGYSEEERRLLEFSALLHDIGWSVSEKKHHIHTMNLVLDAPMPSFPIHEKRLLANIARYHRRSLPKLKHGEYADLSFEDRSRVCRLAALLRIADALDRSHAGRVKQVHCIFLNHSCILSLAGDRPLTEEMKAIERKKDLFTDIYGLDIRVESKVSKKRNYIITAA
jgi:exopolyphosphatase / guanosine-5'-triphosphate,3'-diphosphate pyrophosphatase